MDKDKMYASIVIEEKYQTSVDELCKKERWSRRQLIGVALEYYLKLRGYKENEVQNDN